MREAALAAWWSRKHLIRWVRSQNATVWQGLGFHRKPPCANSFRNLLLALKPEVLETVLRQWMATVLKLPASDTGRAKAAAALHCEGMPTSQIASIVNCSQKTVERDLVVATSPEFLQMVEKHYVQFSTLASLLDKAKKANPSRADDLYDAILEFVVKTKALLRRKDAAQIARSAKPMAEEKKWPQKYLQKSQIASWDKALSKGEPLSLGGSLPFSGLSRFLC